MTRITLHHGHTLHLLRARPAASVHCVVTSPPFWGLRDYGLEPQIWGGDAGCEHEWGDSLAAPGYQGGQNSGLKDCPGGIAHQPRPNSKNNFCPHCGAWRGSFGLEPTLDCLGWATGHPCGQCYICHSLQIYREVRRVLRPDGTFWLNIGDSYNGSGGAGGDYNPGGLKEGQPRYPGRNAPGLKPKDLCGVPFRLALALQADGWWLRRDNHAKIIIWHKTNPMPESCTDRPTTAHEYIFLLTKSGRPTFWSHPRFPGSRQKPKPSYAWRHRKTGKIIHYNPGDPMAWTWRKFNQWQGHDYFYDGEAVREISVTTRPELLEFGPRVDVGFPGHSQNRKRTKAPDGWATHPGGHGSFHQNGREKGQPAIIRNGRNLRSVWTRATESSPEAHFATFPAAIPERCIKAGTSEKGCCPHCGAPWQRVVEKKFQPQEDVSLERGIKGAAGQKVTPDNHFEGFPRGTNKVSMTGWQPTCACPHTEADLIPCTVLDPFSGAGTTCLVAAKLQRNAIGLELNPDYLEMSRQRLNRELGMLVEVEVETP